MINSYFVSYAIGGLLTSLLLPLALTQIARLVPSITPYLWVPVGMVVVITFFVAVFSEEKTAIKLWFFAVGLVGLGVILGCN